MSNETATAQAYDDPADLHRLYWDQGLTASQIADRLGVSTSTVYYQMRKHDINRRNCRDPGDSVLDKLDKEVGDAGSTGRICVPKTWIGDQVTVTRKSATQEETES